jgi:hypothetical protein
VPIDLQQIDGLDDRKGESNEKKKDGSGEKAESREEGMASQLASVSLAMEEIKIGEASVLSGLHGECRRRGRRGGARSKEQRAKDARTLPAVPELLMAPVHNV